MEFSGTFSLEDVSAEEVWVALSDPVMIKQALPGCQFLIENDGDDPDFGELDENAPNEDSPILPDADIDDVTERSLRDGGRYAALIQLSVVVSSPVSKRSRRSIGAIFLKWMLPVPAAPETVPSK